MEDTWKPQYTIKTTKRGGREIINISGQTIIRLVSEDVISKWDGRKVRNTKRHLDSISDNVHSFGSSEAIRAHDYMFQALQRRLRAIRAQEQMS